jgi:putative transposase
MYARGMSTRDIADTIRDMYGIELSAEHIGRCTDMVKESVNEWISRPLNKTYAVLFIDGVVVKIRRDGLIQKEVIYFVIGINTEGHKECLGFYLNATESASYWTKVLQELKLRGLEDPFIICVDNLTGINSAINTIYPKAEIQKCIVHQIRNSVKTVTHKDLKAVISDLRAIYGAININLAGEALKVFKEKWDRKYSYISASWEKNWEELTLFFRFGPATRKMIYTTNCIESFNSKIRKYTRVRTIFPNEESLSKALYLAIQLVTKKWTMKYRHWATVYNELCNEFGNDRLNQGPLIL